MSQQSSSRSSSSIGRVLGSAGRRLSLRAHDFRRDTGLFLLAAALVVVVAVAASQPRAAGSIRAAAGALEPGMRAGSWVGGALTESAATLGDNQRLSQQNAQLAQENRQLAAEVAQLQAVQSENAHLRSTLDLARRLNDRTVAADVVARDPDGLERSLVIAQGSAAGVRVGMTVVSGAGLVGRVATVEPHSAAVETTADPRFTVQVQTATTGLHGTARGGHASLPTQLAVDPNAQPQGGEAVVTAGSDGVPAGIPVGVLSTAGQGAGPRVAGSITPMEDLSQMSFVLVIVGQSRR